MNHIREFSRFAHVYSDYNIIQREVAKDLLSKIHHKALLVADLGCGSGTIYKSIPWKMKSFKAFDLSREMLEHHPSDSHIELICQSFDDKALFDSLKSIDLELIVSSSSLQWSENLKTLFQRVKALDTFFAFSLFTSDTFKTLHETAQTVSPLYSREEITLWAKECLDVDVEFKSYTLNFTNNHEIFRYLKRSGVSGSSNQLNFKQVKKLMKEYPLDYLEFEVAFLVDTKSK